MFEQLFLNKKVNKKITQKKQLLIRPYISMFYTPVYVLLLEFAVLNRFDHV